MVVTGASSSRDERRSTTPSARPRHRTSTMPSSSPSTASPRIAVMRRLMRERRAAAALRVNVMATTSVGKRPGQASGVSRSRGAQRGSGTGPVWACSGWREQGRALCCGQQVLHVALGHHRRLARTRAGVQHDVAVEVKAKPLGVTEGVLHQRPPRDEPRHMPRRPNTLSTLSTALG